MAWLPTTSAAAAQVPMLFRRCLSALPSTGTRADRYCRERVRLHDHEHFFCGLLLPHQLPKEARHQADCLRAGYFALRALNIETAFALDQSYHRATRAPSSFFEIGRAS